MVLALLHYLIYLRALLKFPYFDFSPYPNSYCVCVCVCVCVCARARARVSFVNDHVLDFGGVLDLMIMNHAMYPFLFVFILLIRYD